MARQVWCRPAVIEKSAKVVMLAVHRNDPGPRDAAGYGAPEWVVRLDVMAYPQMRVLDGFGYERADVSAFARSEKDVLALVDAALAGAKRAGLESVLALPAAFGAAAKAPHELLDPAVHVRSAAWRKWIERQELDAAKCAALMEWAGSDALMRIDALRCAAKKLKPKDLRPIVEAGLDANNDYVRSAAFEALPALGAEAGAPLLAACIESARTNQKKPANPNNVLCAAIEASIELPNACLVEPLTKVVEAGEGNNTATLLAVKSLIAIGKKHGAKLVKKPLERALAIEGAHKAAIRELVSNFLLRGTGALHIEQGSREHDHAAVDLRRARHDWCFPPVLAGDPRPTAPGILRGTRRVHPHHQRPQSHVARTHRR